MKTNTNKDLVSGAINLASSEVTGTLPVGNGGTGYYFDWNPQGNGTSPVTAITGTAGYNTYWSDANTIAYEQFVSVGRGGLGADVTPAGAGELLYSTGASAPWTPSFGNCQVKALLIAGGAGAPFVGNCWTDPAIRWHNADLSAAATGGLIHKGASALTSTGALTGVLKGNGSSVLQLWPVLQPQLVWCKYLNGWSATGSVTWWYPTKHWLLSGSIAYSDADSLELVVSVPSGYLFSGGSWCSNMDRSSYSEWSW